MVQAYINRKSNLMSQPTPPRAIEPILWERLQQRPPNAIAQYISIQKFLTMQEKVVQ